MIPLPHPTEPLVYVAGPITKDPFGCVRQATDAFTWLRDFDLVPFLPQLSVLHEMVSPLPYEEWMSYDFRIIEHCSGLLRLDGKSPGADREVAYATGLGIPVLRDPFPHTSGLGLRAARGEWIDCVWEYHRRGTDSA